MYALNAANTFNDEMNDDEEEEEEEEGEFFLLGF